MCLAISAFATPFEIVFNDSTGLTGSDSGDRETTVAGVIKQGAEYVTAVTTDNVFRARENCGVKLGTGSKTGSLSMTLATPTEVDSIVFFLAAYSATEGSATIMGGEAIDLTPAGNKVFAPYVATPAGVVSEVVFASSAKRIYATKVVVYPKAAGTDPVVPGDDYVVEGSIAGTLTPASPALLTTGWSGSTINRGGFALGSDALYFANNTTGHMGKMQLDLSAFAEDVDSIGKGYYMDIDAAGHYVIYEWTAGSASLDAAQVYGADKQLIRRDELGLLARCDMPSCVGDLTSGRAAYFTAGNGANAVLRYNVVDGVMTTVDTIALGFTLGSNNNVSALDVDHFTVQSRGNALAFVDCSGDAPVVTNMSYFGASTFTSAYGGQVFKFAGHTLYVMGTYKVGGYMGSFAVFDITDPAHPYMIAEEPVILTGSAMGTACVTFRVAVEGQTATIYEYAAFQVRKYTLTVSPACYLKQGNEGAEWVSMTAGENGFTYEAVLAADSLFINGAAADAGATMFRLADATVNGTVAVNDTVRFTYNNGALTIDSLGHFVPTVTFNVTVPENTPACYIAGTLNGWTFTRMSQLDATHYTYTWRAEGADAATVAYKYSAGADWAYVEKGANGEELANRAWAESDTVRTWLAVPTVNIISYELNGGVMNDYGWTSKGAILMELQNDYNTAYNSTQEWVKWEDGVYYYHCAGAWLAEDAAAGQASTVADFVQNKTYNTTNNLKTLVETTHAAKYSWIVDVIKANRSAQGLGVDEDDMVENVYRKELSGFFLASPAETSWPAASNFTTTADADFYAPIWKHALSNPETVSAAFTLNAPYKEDATFDGWYADAAFTGAKVLSIDENTASCTLYAKWIEYIPTIAEVKAMADDTNTKVSGVVTFINGKNAYVQDATGGMLLYMKNNPTFTVGQKVLVSGTKTMYGGAPEVKNGEEVSAEDGVMPAAPLYETFGAACKDANLFTRVKFMGLKITSLDSYGNPYVTDGIDTLQCYKMVPDANVFTVGKKINITAILGYYNKYQLVGDVAGMEVVVVGAHDNYSYPARGENGEYTLENKWVISTIEDNFEANKPGPNDNVRGMAAKDGIMYFVNRATASLVRVDGATAEMLEPIKITGEHLFEVEGRNEDGTGNGTYAAAVTLPFNDIKFDGAGHALIGACVSGSQHFMVYKVDLTTGAATLVVDEALVDNDDFATITDEGARTWSGRFDAFGVYGDVDNNAIIMAADANSFYSYKWEIVNGVAQAATRIDCAPDPVTDESLLISNGALTVTSFGTAPQIFPVDENYFYVDGWNALPMLFDMDGVLAEDFISCPTGVAIANNAGDTCKMNVGHNGLCEFQVGDEYFMVMAATNTATSPASSFALYKFADAAKSFSGIEPLWYFPANGMGATTNGCRTAVPSVEVNGTKATIYLYTNNNGYAVYEFTGKEAGGQEDAVENVGVNNNVVKVVENGQVYIIKNGVRYTVLGAVVK